MTVFTPQTEDEIVALVQQAVTQKTPLKITGHGSKQALGRPVDAEHELSMRAYRGVTLYEPEELVISAKAGTPLAEIEALLDSHGQCLGFEPMDYLPLLGHPAAQECSGSLGAMLALNLSGPRRLKAGAARDHVLGVRVVSGRGELFKSGGRVVKNVSGYDLSKLLAGSYGTLGVVSEITLKTVPKPATEMTLALRGADDELAARVMALAMGSREDVSSAAHLPPTVAPQVLGGQFGFKAATLLRFEGIEPSVRYRLDRLTTALERAGAIEILPVEQSRQVWREIRDVKMFVDGAVSKLGNMTKPPRCIWRVSMPPMAGFQMVAALRMITGVDAFYDWQGGLIWLRMEDEPEAEQLRRLIAHFGAAEGSGHSGGHATLVRASLEQRTQIAVFEPQKKALAQLSARIKQQFDPLDILNPGRVWPRKPDATQGDI